MKNKNKNKKKRLGEGERVLYVDPTALGIQGKVRLRHSLSGHDSGEEDLSHFAI